MACSWRFVLAALIVNSMTTPSHSMSTSTIAAKLNDLKELRQAATIPCCKTCEAPRSKYYSVDVPHGFCGETCIRPSLFPVFKIFEPNLTAAAGPNVSVCTSQLTPHAHHYTVYNGTVTHGVPGLSITLDLYAPGPVE